MKEKRARSRAAALAILCLALGACAEEAALGNLFGWSAEPPEYLGCKTLTATEVQFYFSTPVNVRQATFHPDAPIERTDDGAAVSIHLAGEHTGGEELTAELLVEDPHGNTLHVLAPFRTRNDRIPTFHINEIRLDYATASTASGPAHRSEYIELKTETAGNLGAVRLFIAGADPDAPVYQFPPTEAGAGEYIIVHLRSLPSDKATDETGARLDLAASDTPADSPKDARDLWLPTNKKLIHKTDVVYLLDQDDRVLDGAALCETQAAWDKNPAFAQAAGLLAQAGTWLRADGPDAAATAGTSATRTLCRDETGSGPNSRAAWYICATGKASPGKKNSTVKYAPK